MTSCGSCDDEEAVRHKHEYVPTVTEPTCTARGYTTYTCGCGRDYVADYTDPLGHEYVGDICTRCGWIRHDHNYEKTTVEPTCTESGYTRGVCSICGASFNTDFVDPVGHDYKYGVCTRCDKFKPTDGLEYTLSADGEYYICRGIGTATDAEIVIASEFNGKPVKEIGDRAFEGNKNIKKVIISDSITSIGFQSFSNCRGITEIIIPDGVKSIGMWAFLNCSNLTDITIPDSVTDVGMEAFNGCYYLIIYCEAESMPDGWSSLWNSHYSFEHTLLSFFSAPVVWNCRNNRVAEDGYVYAVIDGIRYALNDVAVVASQTINTVGEIAIPQTITYEGKEYRVVAIGDRAFINCSGLTNIIIPDSVTTIGNHAFYRCSGLTNITISDSITTIESGAFNACTKLISIIIPDSVTYVGSHAFNGCGCLTIYCETANKPDGWADNWNKNAYVLYDSGIPVVWNCINNNVATDGKIYAFIDGLRYSLRDGKATVEKQLTSISGEIIIPQTVTFKENEYKVETVKGSAFGGCGNMTSITIPDGVTSIGEGAFSHCDRLERVVIPDSVTSIGFFSFNYCENLTDIFYKGTVMQWKEIDKEELWISNDAVNVHCTDGTVFLY